MHQQAVLGADTEVVVIQRLVLKPGTGGKEATASLTVRAARWQDVPVEPHWLPCAPDVAAQLAEGQLVKLALDLRMSHFGGSTTIRPYIIAAQAADAPATAKAA